MEFRRPVLQARLAPLQCASPYYLIRQHQRFVGWTLCPTKWLESGKLLPLWFCQITLYYWQIRSIYDKKSLSCYLFVIPIEGDFWNTTLSSFFSKISVIYIPILQRIYVFDTLISLNSTIILLCKCLDILARLDILAERLRKSWYIASIS